MSALAVRDLAVTLGGSTILHGLTATFPAGAFSAVVGPNGSGKSTLLRTLVGIHRQSSGSVDLEGDGAPRSVHALPGRERALLIALVEQDGPVPAGLTVRDVVALGRLPHRRWFDDVDLAPFLERGGVAALADRRFDTLSGGERQRVHMARALAQEPTWLVLDEPTNHLDLAAQRDVLGLARELTEGGIAVIAALHDLNHALEYADSVLVLRAGGVHVRGVPGDVLRPDLVREVWHAELESVTTTRGRRLL